MEKIRVFINGYGTIGKRVADAVSLQPDMEVVGVSKVTPNFAARLAIQKGYELFVPEERVKEFLGVGIEAKPLTDGLKEADVIIDATPSKLGANNKPMYENLSKRAIFEGGEKAEVAEVSFVAQVNYEKALNKNYVRVVSCNTTGLARSLHAVNGFLNGNDSGIKEVHATLIRRATDPYDYKKGPINAIVPEVAIPSHHAPDLQTVMNIPITTVAVKVPTTLMHVHSVEVNVRGKKINLDDLKEHLKSTPRIRLVSMSNGFVSTASIIEFARDFVRPRNDVYELIIWEDSITFRNGWLHWIQGVHQEAIVIPENIDAIRAMFNLMPKEESIKLTDKTLGIQPT